MRHASNSSVAAAASKPYLPIYIPAQFRSIPAAPKRPDRELVLAISAAHQSSPTFHQKRPVPLEPTGETEAKKEVHRDPTSTLDEEQKKMDHLDEPLNRSTTRQRSGSANSPRSTAKRDALAKEMSSPISFRKDPNARKEDVELEIEHLAPWAGRMIFYSWYLILVLALVLQSIVTLQWDANDLCFANAVSLTHFDNWNSQGCLSVANFSNSNLTDFSWHGQVGMLFASKLNRFPQIVLTAPTPANLTDAVTFSLNFGLVVTNSSDNAKGSTLTTLEKSITCQPNKPRCTAVIIPTTTTYYTNNSDVTLSLTSVQPALENAMRQAGVAVIYQKSAYTITTIVLRYVFIVFSLLHLVRFLANKKFTNSIYEQTWIFILQASLFVYLDPLFAAGVYLVPQPDVLQLWEFRIPTYFIAILVAFMYSLLTSSMAWTDQEHSADPPWPTKLAAFVFVLVILVLDLVDAGASDWKWSSEHCPNFSCNEIGYILYGFLILGVLVCSVWLWWLRSNLGQKPYLESRPQQLACRVFILMFISIVFYFVIQALTIVFLYGDITGIVTYQVLIQVSPILVATAFVNVMTFVYTTTARTNTVPIRPTDARWKRVVWPMSWYQWIVRHGGSMYIFFSEKEENAFNDIQQNFARVRHAEQEFFDTVIVQEGQTEQFNNVNDDDDLLEDDDEEHHQSATTHHLDDETGYHSATSSSSSASQYDGGKRKSDSISRVVQKSVSRLVARAEETFITRPAAFFEGVSERILDSTVFTGSSHSRKPFFNLETAVDCFNLSWEAYGVSVSAGDSYVSTGIKMPTPHVPTGLLSRCFGAETKDDVPPHAAKPTDSPQRQVLQCPEARSPSQEAERDVSMKTYGSTTLPNMSGSMPPPSGPPINTEQYGYIRVAVFEQMDVQVVISRSDLSCPRHRIKPMTKLVVAFRGTDNASNAKQDLRFHRVTWEEAAESESIWRKTTRAAPTVHVGFLEIWNALRTHVTEAVFTEIHAHPEREYTLVTTGHSLGGAVAVLAAFALCRQLRELAHTVTNFDAEPVVYTYGQPRIGNKAFQTIYNKNVPRTFRIVNESDVVTSITMFGGCHVGMEVDVDRNGNFICEPMFMERMLRPTKGKGSGVANHAMGAYAESLNSIVGKTHLGTCPSKCLEPYVAAATPPKS